MNAYELIGEERGRQDAKWGGPSHDDEHSDAGLAIAGAVYGLDAALAVLRAENPDVQDHKALGDIQRIRDALQANYSPCGHSPADPLTHFVKGAALYVAEIERLQRAQQQEDPSHG